MHVHFSFTVSQITTVPRRSLIIYNSIFLNEFMVLNRHYMTMRKKFKSTNEMTQVNDLCPLDRKCSLMSYYFVTVGILLLL